ncbi:hypothetical protein KAF25_002327 [Fusarium avenaceum]|uniref:CBM-cenC domain-containing protein n=1 Tax=Fusarium avenaceum TaxID=40199 RepID=A0A9P7H0V1_9HYPO|nr:hypothetical protein KAF25_002327 [Fusarium avenaceum]
MSSIRSLIALVAIGLFSTGASSGPCKPSVSASISAEATTHTGTAIDNTSTFPTQGSASSSIMIEESSTAIAHPTTTSEALVVSTTAQPTTSISVCHIENPTNYIRNPSFESPTPSSEDSAIPWTVRSNAEFKHQSDGKPAHSGNYMVTVGLQNPRFDDSGEVSQQVTGLTVGSWYRASYYWTPTYISNPTWNNRCYISVTAGASHSSYKDNYVSYTNPGEFSQRSFDFKASSSDLKLLFYVWCDYDDIRVDYFILDDFELVEICPPLESQAPI